MSKARQKGTRGENFFLATLRTLFGEQVERAPLKGIQDRGDYVGVPWLHEAKNTAAPMFLQWARQARRKVGLGADWVILWKGDLRLADYEPLVVMPLHTYEDLVLGVIGR